MPRVGINAEFVMAAVDILDEGVSRADHSALAQPLQPAHGPQSGFQAAVIGSMGLLVYCSVT